MSEAIISRRGKSGGSSNLELRTDIITDNQEWTVPLKIKGNVSVRIFGGGGGGNEDDISGGGGWMNNGEFKLNGGDVINIVIGKGGIASTGANGRTGGTTTFGTYLSANGASSSGGSGGGGGGIGYQFGGGGGYRDGGRGGTWGGGGGNYSPGNGGNGGIYGGGGGASSDDRTTYRNGGNGGMYGGGGGGSLIVNKSSNSKNMPKLNEGRKGFGGEYGANATTGILLYRVAWEYNKQIIKNVSMPGEIENGINTLGNNQVPEECRGAGITPYNAFHYTSENITDEMFNKITEGYLYQVVGHCGGGGGGYYVDGGNGSDSNAGGGGGYDKGQDGKSGSAEAGFGARGCSNGNGGKGICIIQYYI